MFKNIINRIWEEMDRWWWENKEDVFALLLFFFIMWVVTD